MPQIPRKESDLIAQVNATLRGLIDHPEDFPDVPAGQAVLGPVLNEYSAAVTDMQNKEEAYRAVVAQKNELLKQIRQHLVDDLRYCERVTKDDPTKLLYVGWAPRKTPEPIALPATPLNLCFTTGTRGTLTLTWKRAVDPTAGAARFFIVQRRSMDSGEVSEWQQTKTVKNREVTLTDQPIGVELEYRVFARNVSGNSAPTTAVGVVL